MLQLSYKAELAHTEVGPKRAASQTLGPEWDQLGTMCCRVTLL